ncbi:MAG: ABC transporter permease [Treponema sp.]|jgi:phospholipid/cholesterol/gamma-HCH transport system permease protein|nr:ABC transporter permease [Treponema sp.]
MFARVLNKLDGLGRYFTFLGELLRSVVMRPFRFAQVIAEIELLGVNSIMIILLSGGAIGMIFALQMVVMFQMFQAEVGTGAAVAIAMARELAPIITTLMLIAKNGSAMAAELGTMQVTEQIDALESMSINVVQYLVLPKVIASILVFPVLTLLANVIGALGAYVISTELYGIDSASYLDYMFDLLKPADVASGLIKATVMGFITATICCFYGLHTTQGAKGVGDSATKAVVASSVSILMADYIMASMMMRLLYG